MYGARKQANEHERAPSDSWSVFGRNIKGLTFPNADKQTTFDRFWWFELQYPSDDACSCMLVRAHQHSFAFVRGSLNVDLALKLTARNTRFYKKIFYRNLAHILRKGWKNTEATFKKHCPKYWRKLRWWRRVWRRTHAKLAHRNRTSCPRSPHQACEEQGIWRKLRENSSKILTKY